MGKSDGSLGLSTREACALQKDRDWRLMTQQAESLRFVFRPVLQLSICRLYWWNLRLDIFPGFEVMSDILHRISVAFSIFFRYYRHLWTPVLYLYLTRSGTPQLYKVPHGRNFQRFFQEPLEPWVLSDSSVQPCSLGLIRWYSSVSAPNKVTLASIRSATYMIYYPILREKSPEIHEVTSK